MSIADLLRQYTEHTRNEDFPIGQRVEDYCNGGSVLVAIAAGLERITPDWSVK
jgi:hypothetical protein